LHPETSHKKALSTDRALQYGLLKKF